MKIGLYCIDDKENSPFENYISKRIGKSLNIPNKKYAESFWMEVVTKCLHVAENNGITNDQYTKKLREYDCIEIRIKHSPYLVRIPFCIDSENNRIVLLSGFDKPDRGYKKKGKVARKVEKEYKTAQGYYDDYIKNKNKCKSSKLFN